MQMIKSPLRHNDRNAQWRDQIFGAKAEQTGGIVRRQVKDVEREIGRDRLIEDVRVRGFHMIECGGQFIIICNAGQMRVLVNQPARNTFRRTIGDCQRRRAIGNLTLLWPWVGSICPAASGQGDR